MGFDGRVCALFWGELSASGFSRFMVQGYGIGSFGKVRLQGLGFRIYS